MNELISWKIRSVPQSTQSQQSAIMSTVEIRIDLQNQCVGFVIWWFWFWCTRWIIKSFSGFFTGGNDSQACRSLASEKKASKQKKNVGVYDLFNLTPLSIRSSLISMQYMLKLPI